MAKRSNPKLIGAFVVGAIALVILGVLAFGGGEYFAPKGKAVLFFQGSLAGLDVGSPVTFRGVKVGSVTAIVIQYDVRKQRLHIPVFIEINPEKFEIVSGNRSENNLRDLVQRGLRAKLTVQSLVTGQASVDFDFYPDTPIRLINVETDVPQLPTTPSDIDLLKANLTSLMAKIGKLPLEQLSSELLETVRSADQTMRNTDAVVQRAGALVDTLNGQVKPLADSLKATTDQATALLREAQARLELRPGEPLQNLNDTLGDARKLLNNVDAGWPQILAAAVQALKTAHTTLGQTDAVLKSAQAALTPSSPVYFELVSTLRELKYAATAIKVFAEYIQRNPSALLTGNH